MLEYTVIVHYFIFTSNATTVMVQFDHFVHCCCVMALFTFDEVDLIDFITPSLADTPPFVQKNNNVSCDKVLQILTSKINSCKYFKVVAPKTNLNFPNSLVLVHLNIRSLYKHFDSLCLFLQSLPFKPDVICLTETRVKGQPLANINLPITGLFMLHLKLMLVVLQFMYC